MIVHMVRLLKKGEGWFGDRLAIEIPYKMTQHLGWKKGDNLVLTIASGHADIRIRRDDYDATSEGESTNG